jgi:hypothetical protein
VSTERPTTAAEALLVDHDRVFWVWGSGDRVHTARDCPALQRADGAPRTVTEPYQIPGRADPCGRCARPHDIDDRASPGGSGCPACAWTGKGLGEHLRDEHAALVGGDR